MIGGTGAQPAATQPTKRTYRHTRVEWPMVNSVTPHATVVRRLAEVHWQDAGGSSFLTLKMRLYSGESEPARW